MCAKCHIVKQGLISHGNVLGGTYTSLKELFCFFFFFKCCFIMGLVLSCQILKIYHQMLSFQSIVAVPVHFAPASLSRSMVSLTSSFMALVVSVFRLTSFQSPSCVQAGLSI